MIKRQLYLDSYSEDRKEAMKEIYGDNWKKERGKKMEEIQLKTIQITCIVCKEKKWASKKRAAKLVEKFGSMKKLVESYKCRECRKVKKDETTKDSN